MARSETKKDGFWDTLKTVFWALIIAMVFRSTLYQPFSIPSGSMKPTLLIGDYLFVSKFAYGYSHFSLPFAPDWFEGRIWAEMPERGDVVVFKRPGKDACTQGPIGMVAGLVGALTDGGGKGHDDCVDYVTLNRPEIRNAVNDAVITELTHWAESATQDPRLRMACSDTGLRQRG